MTDNGTTQREKSLVNIIASFIANAQAAKLVQPAQRALDDPARFAQAAAMGPPFTGQPVGNALAAQPVMVCGAAIGAVSLHQVRPLTGAAWFAAHWWDRHQQRLELTTVMDVGCSHLDAQRNALGIGEKMMFAARFAAVGRVRPRLEPPKTARTLLESTTARDQSIRSALCSRRSSSRWSFSHTPAFCQSRKRRQQVMPLPQPISKGKSRQAMPVLSTNRIPVNAARSGMDLRPGYFTRRVLLGSNGSITVHSDSSSSAFGIHSLLQKWSNLYNSYFVTGSKTRLDSVVPALGRRAGDEQKRSRG